jgi:hypothetical protein
LHVIERGVMKLIFMYIIMCAARRLEKGYSKVVKLGKLTKRCDGM